MRGNLSSTNEDVVDMQKSGSKTPNEAPRASRPARSCNRSSEAISERTYYAGDLCATLRDSTDKVILFICFLFGMHFYGTYHPDEKTLGPWTRARRLVFRERKRLRMLGTHSTDHYRLDGSARRAIIGRVYRLTLPADRVYIASLFRVISGPLCMIGVSLYS